MNNLIEKYIEKCKQACLLNVKLISPSDIVFDIRTQLKCRWGCKHTENSIKCSNRGLSYDEKIKAIEKYSQILLLHSNDAQQISRISLEIEKDAFLDGFYFAFALRACNLCKPCSLDIGKDCPNPEKIRPCDQSFGINIFETVKRLNLPIKVLTDKDEIPNRYGFVCIY